MEYVWIGIGSNLLNPKKQVDQAICAVSTLPKTKFISCSKYYRSYPLGFHKQPDFLNTVILLYTGLNPELLLSYLQKIECKQGRCRKILSCCKYQPRTLDLDILLFGKYMISTSNLIIPHYDMMFREFVIYPLIELDRNFMFPNGKYVVDLAKDLPKNGLILWKD